MGFRDKMKAMKKDLVRTTQESIDRGEDTPEYGSIFIRDKIPSGVGFWRPTFGDHLIDVVPFLSAGYDPKYEKGRWVYLFDGWVHMNVGALYDQYVCQQRAFKEIDPMCEYLRAKRLPTDEWKKIAPKRRTAYLIWCHDTPEEEAKGIQIWEVAHWNFEKHLSKISKHPKGGAPIPFSDVDEGKSIAFEIVKSGTFTNDQGKEQDSSDYAGHRFVEREEPIPDDWDDKIFSLDACIKFKPTWDEQAKAFPLSAEIPLVPESVASKEKQGDDVIEEKKLIKGFQCEQCGSAIYDTASGKVCSKGHGGIVGILPEERVKALPKTETDELECPADGTIGVDFETLPGCKKCAVWDPCADLADTLKKQTKKVEKTKEPEPTEKKKIIRRRRS